MTAAPEMTITSLILGASPVVQAVMLILVLASVMSWGIILQRRAVYSRAKALASQFEERFWSGADMRQLSEQVGHSPNTDSGCENLFRAGFQEFQRLREKNADSEATMQGVARALRIALSVEQSRLEAQLPFLASVGSTSPYIGLFGTVWGIMSSFIGLAKVQQATLAVVAPGIAEALIATAIGLFAAIPAVLAYNRFAADSDSVLSRYEIFAEELSSILHREAHAGRSTTGH
ncbi:cell division and transport-associated protein TolQ [Paraperlucidibaca baekdonensis]|uniref:Tol-Pal system protein TolQ n=1 Tax=Paraperlucidibaca baekdonensis TaxID=748120 RepID=A0A3E0H2P4_9GAMM|nr:protein TolQ [Paraperlucidibaca baekdonensis]REH36779.1 cell division and transport-associated protein TolQ [Paraperlucidibaca baekdonensis]